jgi:hypothetical protein
VPFRRRPCSHPGSGAPRRAALCVWSRMRGWRAALSLPVPPGPFRALGRSDPTDRAERTP